MKRCLVALLALALAACASTSGEYAKGSGKTLSISKEIWSSYQAYLQDVGGAHPGAFAVSVDGAGSAWTWCEDMRCITGAGYANEALQDCRRAYGMDCLIFARGTDIVVNYEIVD